MVPEEEFHKSRRMFVFHKGLVFLAEKNSPLSHSGWFESIGWNSEDVMENSVRGFVSWDGDVYFYKGEDFHVDRDAEREFFELLPKLSEKLMISRKARIYGGLQKANIGWLWNPLKKYGFFGDLSEKKR